MDSIAMVPLVNMKTIGITLAVASIIFGEDKAGGSAEFRKYASLVKLDKPLDQLVVRTTAGTMRIPVEGKVNILVPQYVNCPEICHLESLMMALVMGKTLEAGYADSVVFITIEVDADRTDEKVVTDYMERVAGDMLDQIRWVWILGVQPT